MLDSANQSCPLSSVLSHACCFPSAQICAPSLTVVVGSSARKRHAIHHTLHNSVDTVVERGYAQRTGGVQPGGSSRKTVQTFIKVDGCMTFPLDVSLSDKVGDIVENATRTGHTRGDRSEEARN